MAHWVENVVVDIITSVGNSGISSSSNCIIRSSSRCCCSVGIIAGIFDVFCVGVKRTISILGVSGFPLIVNQGANHWNRTLPLMVRGVCVVQGSSPITFCVVVGDKRVVTHVFVVKDSTIVTVSCRYGAHHAVVVRHWQTCR